MKLLVSLLFLIPCQAFSFFFGVHEGLMANTGVATLESKAASYYNPSLLRYKSKNSFTLGGSTLGEYSSSTKDGTAVSGASLTPTYLSNVFSSSSLVHELFIYNNFSGIYGIKTQTAQSDIEGTVNITNLVGGYSMAFQSIPLALQVQIRYISLKTAALFSSLDTNLFSVGKTVSQQDYASLNLGISHHFTINKYTFGVNLKTRGLKVMSKYQSQYKGYIISNNQTSPVEYKNTEGNSGVSVTGYELSIGHGFNSDNHEFLTDTKLVEEEAYKNQYILSQSFGYRFKLSKNYQYSAGVNQQFGDKLKGLGQAIGVSTGLIMRTNSYLSSIGLGYLRDESQTSTAKSFNLIFSSEFYY